jgi:predicted molibdopterin-dependent oxidoreductase YjgC
MNQRITTPYIRNNEQLKPVSFEEAFQYVVEKMQATDANQTLVMSSGSYSNETLYLLQRLARTTLNTNALGSFDYYRRGTDFFADKNDIVPFAELFQSDRFYCIFEKPVETSPETSLQIHETLKAVVEILNRCPDTPRYWFNMPGTLHIIDYYAFFRCVNFYLIHHHLEKGIYVDVLGKNYWTYKEALLADDYAALLQKNLLKDVDIQIFVDDLLKCSTPVFIVWEQWLTAEAYHELENLCMLLDIQSKPATGFLTIKSELNSQGLYDMGLFPHVAPGGHTLNDEMRQKLEAVLQTPVCAEPIDVPATLDREGFRNVLLWNPLNAEIPQDVVNQIDKADFALLQTAYLPENTDQFDVILPANLPEEVSGTYTDTAKVPHNFVSEIENPLEYNNLQQITKLAEKFGHIFPDNKDEIFLEYISFMEAGCHSSERHFFK